MLLRELVAEFTLTDSTATTAVCLAGLLGQSEDSVVLNSWCQASDQQIVEDAVSTIFLNNNEFKPILEWSLLMVELPLDHFLWTDV